MQNTNGPCPLIALCNALLLRGDLSLHPDLPTTTFDRLAELLGDLLLQRPLSLQDPTHDEMDHNIDSVLATIPSLQFGLDVNVHFSSALGFEATSALHLFKIFGVRLVHGWVCDPEDAATAKIIADKLVSYNRVVEAIVAGDDATSQLQQIEKQAAASGSNAGAGSEAVSPSISRTDLETRVMEGLICSQFIADTASQLTRYGLRQIEDSLLPNELCVYFRNNHFSTLFKHPERGLFVLITDQGFANEHNMIWEMADRIDGNSDFFNADFELFTPVIDDSLRQQIDATNNSNNPHSEDGE
eukprot:jgi/Hompol1/5170/HPOL_004198-RA